MGIARSPSAITLPPSPGRRCSILEFLVATFPHVPADRWHERLRDGKLHDVDGRAITLSTPYQAGLRLFYYREVDVEPVVPFEERIVFRNDEFLVADKPHFLPTVPGGNHVNECLQERLRRHIGQTQLVPLHRIDRDTAGLVLCSLNPESRHRYHELFASGHIEKEYEALAQLESVPERQRWSVANRLVRGEPRFRMRVADGPINARSEIEWRGPVGELGHFRLRPLTGKTHQLRVHMAHIGFPIVNDPYYPALRPRDPGDFSQPLQLVARGLRFRDPVTGTLFAFESGFSLNL